MLQHLRTQLAVGLTVRRHATYGTASCQRNGRASIRELWFLPTERLEGSDTQPQSEPEGVAYDELRSHLAQQDILEPIEVEANSDGTFRVLWDPLLPWALRSLGYWYVAAFVRGGEGLEAELPFAAPARLQWEGREIVGRHPGFLRAISLAEAAARGDSRILIQGETGTGKELVAHLTHERSPRRAQPFDVVDVHSLPETLFESEVFGHESGAFTGAVERRVGLMLSVGDGTLVLDEIGDMTPVLQVKLLRVLEEGKVRPVGSNEKVAVRARIIATTNRDLWKEVEEGRFRKDLFYRLSVIHITIPPLRERKQDIPDLVGYLLTRHAGGHCAVGIAPEAMDLLLLHDWPGNVRELDNLIERGLLVSTNGIIGVADLPERFLHDVGARTQQHDGSWISVPIELLDPVQLATVRLCELLRQNGEMTLEEIRGRSGLGANEWRKVLPLMNRLGLWERWGRGRHVRYRRGPQR